MSFDFEEMKALSEEEKLRESLVCIYKEWIAMDCIVEYVEGKETQTKGIDLLLKIKKPMNAGYIEESIEEKIRGKSYSENKDILIETISSAETKTAGWIYTSQSNWLSYVWNGLPEFIRILILPLQPLKQWFVCNSKNYKEVSTTTNMGNGFYTTKSKIIPFTDEKFRKHAHAHGFFYKRYDYEKNKDLKND